MSITATERPDFYNGFVSVEYANEAQKHGSTEAGLLLGDAIAYRFYNERVVGYFHTALSIIYEELHDERRSPTEREMNAMREATEFADWIAEKQEYLYDVLVMHEEVLSDIQYRMAWQITVLEGIESHFERKHILTKMAKAEAME